MLGNRHMVLDGTHRNVLSRCRRAASDFSRSYHACVRHALFSDAEYKNIPMKLGVTSKKKFSGGRKGVL
jgi:hypothetical protein